MATRIIVEPSSSRELLVRLQFVRPALASSVRCRVWSAALFASRHASWALLMRLGRSTDLVGPSRLQDKPLFATLRACACCMGPRLVRPVRLRDCVASARKARLEHARAGAKTRSGLSCGCGTWPGRSPPAPGFMPRSNSATRAEGRHPHPTSSFVARLQARWRSDADLEGRDLGQTSPGAVRIRDQCMRQRAVRLIGRDSLTLFGASGN